MSCTKCGNAQPVPNKHWCRDCINAYSREHYAKNQAARTEQQRERYAHSDAKWAYNLQRNYGLTADEYSALLQSQDGVCAICSSPPSGRITRLVVDHDHETGRVRGLLCTRCNHMLGNARDDIVLLLAGADYLTHRSMVMDCAEGGARGFRPRYRARFT